MADQTPIRFTSAEEFQARPSWTSSLDPRTHKLSKIIGDYAFAKKDELPCGLVNCRQIHQHGYVVETLEGAETNIGRDCGKKHFNVQWGEIQATYDRAAKERDLQVWIDGMLASRESLLAKGLRIAEELTSVDARLGSLWNSLAKEQQIINAIRDVHRAGGAVQVTQEVDRATAEAMNLPSSQRRTLRTIARVEGVAVLVPSPTSQKRESESILSLLRGRVIPFLRGLDAEAAAMKRRARRRELQLELEQAGSAIEQGSRLLATIERFLSADNLQSLAKIELPRPTDRARRILARLGQGLEA